MNLKRTKEDAQWSKAVRLRDQCCVVCGKTKALNAHHILPKQLPETRYDLMNGITLCAGCHKWKTYSAHQNALWWIAWLREHRFEVFEYLSVLVTPK